MEIDITDISPRIEKIVSKRFEKVKTSFVAGKTYIPSSGHIYDDKEVNAAIRSLLSGKWNDGKEAHCFEQTVAHVNQRRCGVLCNSGSSANLLALSATMSKKNGERRLRAGQEVITSLVGFPTTLNAILQLGLIPVFVDCEIPSYNANPCLVEEAVGKNTGAILLAHTLGNPVSLNYIEDNVLGGAEIWSIYDCCDALGGNFTGTFAEGRPLGSFGDISTLSFYPAHQITIGEGGMVLTNSPMTNSILRSLRDWGRECWCPPGCDNTCGKRFTHEYESLPNGYDHKYVYSEIGFNLKSTDIQAAIGNEQIKRLPAFVKARQKNWKFYHDAFKAEKLDNYFILPEPHKLSDPSWFGFALTCKNGVDRTKLTQYLESKRIGTRNLFGGNLLKQPAYKDIPHKLVGTARNADIVTEKTFWIGVHPGITSEMRDYVVDTFKEGVK
jgi:CDP-6-deoxy-D-xylo-4-hexulose-3-dehydrase